MKKSQFAARLGNNQGQAIIEYVLMLIISVSLVLALMNQIFKPFGAFVENYMGKYVQCLLEYGELPSFGGEQTSEADEDSECNKKFGAATLAGGRPPANGKDGSGGSSGDGQGSSKNSGSGSDSSSSGGSSGGSYAGSASRGGGRYVNRGRSPSMGMESGADPGGGKVVEIALEGGGAGGFFKGSNGNRYMGVQRKVSSVAITGLTDAEKKKLEKKAEGGSKVIATSDGLGPAPKKTTVKPPPEKSIIEEEKPLTIGNFIRYLFIAALVIALVIFIGGQALQMSKGFDK